MEKPSSLSIRLTLLSRKSMMPTAKRNCRPSASASKTKGHRFSEPQLHLRDENH